MKNSITKDLKDKAVHKDIVKKSFKPWAILFWIALWQIVSMLVSQELLLASPVSVVQKLAELVITWGFWQSILFSFSRIMAGFFTSLIIAVLLAALSAHFKFVKDLLAPIMSVLKATPVASVTILILIWISSRNLSFFLSIVMILPIIYSNVLTGIEYTNPLLLEMVSLFRVPFGSRLRYVYIPEVLPYFSAAIKISLGICWKAGIAAEVIGRPKGSIGEMLYEAKIYLETPDLFAWTLVIVLLSILIEKLLILAVEKIIKRLEVS